MFDYLRYYLSPATLLFGIVGLYLGGGYVWLGLATLPILAIGDTLLPRDLAERQMSNETLAFIPVLMSCGLAFVSFVLLAWQAGSGTLSTLDTFGAVVSTGWIGTIVGIPAFHELFHRRTAYLRYLGLCLQVMYGDPTRDIAHVVGHHIDVGTRKDSDTAWRGETLFTFGFRAARGSFMTGLEMEGNALEKRGLSRWSIKHRLWRALAGYLAFQAVMYLIGGWAAVAACFAATSLARFLLESFNYFQHYGQVRCEGSTIKKHHVWNHFGRLSRAMTFEITNHSGHHLNSYAPYYDLKPDRDAVMLPSVFICFMSALIPPIWHRMIIMPALKEWDLKHASAQERELARAQNLAAGWPDWFAAEAANAPSAKARAA
ncbi:alkane 1-monooxygenase [uncultured Nevskia sp.]|uniref:alkane 1-monooxygenase n=1 Tax=uncultured Nevskia sp. TaxID=228950 RepID=UPI0025D55F61|nr:alkane 1-monooxygenase [uncultured Nevskia sp.]